jgi:tetratricopeptide (TPR) repeat protein
LASDARFRAIYEEGLAHTKRQQHAAAAACFLRALALDPQSAPAHFNLGMALLAQGEFKSGWIEYEWRHKLDQARGSHPPLALPGWNGMRLPEGRVLLIGDQGYGDTIQFARYVPMVAERCREVVLGLSPQLIPLVSRIKGAGRAFSHWEHMPPVDAWCMMSSLPGLFGTEPNAIPSKTPYLEPDPATVVRWTARLAEVGATKRPRIGLFWAGRTEPPHDARRSLPFAYCAALLGDARASFVSLQHELPLADVSSLAETNALLDLRTELKDFGETAAVIANLDLVITIDSAVAHLAGALGKNAWVLLQWQADWRWFRDREDSPWYPSLRLFRQPEPGAWGAVIERVSEELAAFVGTKTHGKGKTIESRAAPKRMQAKAPPAAPAAAPVVPIVPPPLAAGGPAPVRSANAALIAQTLATADQHRRSGRLSEAEALCRDVLKDEPHHAEAYHMLAVIAHQAGNMPVAIEMLRLAIAANDRIPLYHSNYCELLRLAGRTQEAVAAGERATILDPTLPQAHCNLGVAYYDAGDYRAAARSYERALAHDPQFAEAWSNLGNALRAQHKLDDALVAYDRALAVRRDYADAHANKASTLHLIGRIDEAIATYRHAIALDPMQANAHSGLSLLLLLNGNLDYGWMEYEWRWRSSEMPARRVAGTLWEGDRTPGKRLFIHSEQGLGDALQFVRYLPLLMARGASIILLVPETLRILLVESLPAVTVWDEQAPLPPYDRHCPLLSLPRLFRTTLESIPADVPYVRAPKEAAARWAERLGDARGLKVGIVWSGNPKHINDPARSIAIETLAPLFAVSGTSFYSLQVGPRADDLARLGASGVIPLARDLTSFAETAGAVAHLDLVVTIDSSVAHLAGAMGKPVWILTPAVPDWRWLFEREDNPWYPTARLFRQKTRLDWAPVIERVAHELTRVAGGERRRLLP